MTNELEDYKDVLRGDPCAYCGGVAGQVDHIVPREVGGEDAWENCTGACPRCNQSKSRKSLLLFLQERVADTHRPQPITGVRWRGGLRPWDARIHGVGKDGASILLGSFTTPEEACAVREAWIDAHPDALTARERRRLATEAREQRVRDAWHAGSSKKEIARLEGATESAISGVVDRMRAKGEDVMRVGRGGPGQARRSRAGEGGDQFGYSYNTQSKRLPWLVQVSQGTHRHLRARFASEDEAIAAVAEFRAGMLKGPEPRCALETARRRRGLSQVELASMVGCTPGTIAGIELGQTSKPHKATRTKLADALAMTEAELFGDVPAAPGRSVGPSRLIMQVARDEQDPLRPWTLHLQQRFATVEEAQAASEDFLAAHQTL